MDFAPLLILLACSGSTADNGYEKSNFAMDSGVEITTPSTPCVPNCRLPSEVALSDADAKMIGEAAHDRVERTSNAGDVDGDGLDDFIVSTILDGGGFGAGATYLVYGPVFGTLDLANANAKIIGEEPSYSPSDGDSAGISLSAAGDNNGDGFDDIIIGSFWNDGGGNNAGAAYVVLGPIIGNIELANANTKFVGEFDNDNAGSVSSAGDTNGDGIDDIIIGAFGSEYGGIGENYQPSGAAYIWLGPTAGIVSQSNANAKLIGQAGDYAGLNVAGLGDVDGDGLGDVVVSAHLNEDGGELAGAVYLLNGPIIGTINLSDADAELIGQVNDAAGHGLSSVGDVNGDSLDDIIVGAPQSTAVAVDIGAVYLMHGPAAGRIELAASSWATLLGETLNVGVGTNMSVSGAGDVDGDGFDDIIIGSGASSAGDLANGLAYLLYGPVSGTVVLSDSDTIFIGEVGLDHAGGSVSGAGDTNGDGLDDLLIGAFGNDEGGEDAGAVYLVLGGT